MRVLHLTTHLDPGGITVYILRLIPYFKRMGIETFVISSGGEYSGLLRELGAHVEERPIRTKNEYHLKLYLAIPPLIRFIRENKIDVIHAHTRVTQAVAAWLQFFTGVEVVTTCHGFFKRRLGRRINPAWGKRVIAISEAVGEEVQKSHKVPGERVRVVPNGIDFEETDRLFAAQTSAQAKRSFGFGEQDRVIGIVARLVADKGHVYLIQALGRLKKNYPDMRLLIVGDGRERAALEELAAALDLSASVRFTGSLKNVTAALAAMDVFVFPPTWREGFGLSLVEAMACHRPVIATRIWALDRLIEDGRTGLLVEAKDADALAAAVTRVLEDRVLRESLCAQARKMAETRYGIERMARQIGRVYEEVLRGSA